MQGHIDAVGTLLKVLETDQAHVLQFNFPGEFTRYVIEKGSISIDGVSLTVVNLRESTFEVWIVPHTWEHTNMAKLEIDQGVNLEFDLISKYVEKLVQPLRSNN